MGHSCHLYNLYNFPSMDNGFCSSSTGHRSCRDWLCKLNQENSIEREKQVVHLKLWFFKWTFVNPHQWAILHFCRWSRNLLVLSWVVLARCPSLSGKGSALFASWNLALVYQEHRNIWEGRRVRRLSSEMTTRRTTVIGKQPVILPHLFEHIPISN